MRKVDCLTVKALEVQAPGASSSDGASLFRALKEGNIFEAFSLEERMKIWAKLYTIDSFVPTLWAFFENFKYIKACAACVKSLVEIPPKMTLFRAMERSFLSTSQRNGYTMIQKSERVFSSRSGQTQNRVGSHYRQVFLYVMRHLRELSPKSTKLERSRNRRRTRTVLDKAAWYAFVELAERLGFRSERMRKLKVQYSQYARVHSPSQPPRPGPNTKPVLVVDGAGESFERRHACPFDLAYEQSRGFLFFDNMHSVESSQGSSVTPFFVRKSVYLTFFGRLTCGPIDSDSPVTQHVSPISSFRVTRDEDEEQRSDMDLDLVTYSQPQTEQTTNEASEEIYPENEDRHTWEEEDDLGDCYEARGYMDQLPDISHQFDSPPPSQSLQLPRKPSSIEDMEEGSINEYDSNGNGDSQMPSILSSSFYSEDFIEANAGAEAGQNLQALLDEGSPLQEEVPSEAASQVHETPSLYAVAEGVGEAAQDRFRFILRDGDDWVTMEEYSITTSLSSLVEATAEKHAAQGRYLLDIDLWSLDPSQCYEAALAHGTHIILLFPPGSICIDEQLAASAASLCPDARPLQRQTRKRVANEEVSQQRDIQKRHRH